MSFTILSWICAGVITLIGIIIAIVTQLNPTWSKKAGIVCILLVTTLIIIPLIFSNEIELKIINPPSNTLIGKNDYKEKDYNGKKLITIPINIAGKELPKGKYVTLITTESGSTKSWINGGSIQTDVLEESLLTLDNATFGEKNDGKTIYLLYLIMTDTQLVSGKSFTNDKLPDYIAKSKTVMLKIEK